MRIPPPLILSVLALALLGCGQKGSLVLPDAEHPRKKISIAKPPSVPVPTSGAPSTAPPPAAAPPTGQPPPQAEPASAEPAPNPR